MRGPRLYLVSPAEMTACSLADAVSELADAGVDIVQLREKDLEAGDLMRAAEPVAEACAEAGVPLVINDRADVALALGLEGAHLGQNDLPPKVARRILPTGLIGLSTHRASEVDGALSEEAIDYFTVGPVYETPTKPGRPAAGLGLVRYAAEAHTNLTWFAIGGIDERSLPEVMSAGATRIVVVRAITEAADPVAAAARLRTALISF